MLIGVRQWCCWSRCDLLWEKQGPARIGGDKGVADVKVNGLEFVTGETEKTENSNDVACRGEVKRAKKLFLCLKTLMNSFLACVIIFFATLLVIDISDGLWVIVVFSPDHF